MTHFYLLQVKFKPVPRNFLIQNFADDERDDENHTIV